MKFLKWGPKNWKNLKKRHCFNPNNPILFPCFIKWLGNLRNGFPTPENVLLDPRITWMGQKKQNLGSPARSRFFPKWTFSVFWLFFYQFWLWSTVESTWMVNLTSYVSSGIHINAKQTPGAPLGAQQDWIFRVFGLFSDPFWRGWHGQPTTCITIPQIWVVRHKYWPYGLQIGVHPPFPLPPPPSL